MTLTDPHVYIKGYVSTPPIDTSEARHYHESLTVSRLTYHG
jgi:hypothetical protein